MGIDAMKWWWVVFVIPGHGNLSLKVATLFKHDEANAVSVATKIAIRLMEPDNIGSVESVTKAVEDEQDGR